MQYFVDTNIFLRTLIKEDEVQFNKCRIFLQQIKENKIEAYTNTLVLAEVVWTLTSYYQFSKSSVIQALRSIINLRGLKIVDNYDYLTALGLFEKYSVKYIDTLIASNSQVHSKQATIVTYDQDFKKLPVLYKEPWF